MNISGEQRGTVSVKQVLKLAWPMMIGMLSFTVMDFTDTLVAGHLGKAEVAAVGLATTAILLINAFFLGLFESVKIFVAQSTGSDHPDFARYGGWQGIYIALPAGFLVIALGGSGPLLFLLSGAPEHVRILAQDYFIVRVFASLPWYITLALSNFYQGQGNTKLPMNINLTMCVVNVALDFILVYGLGPIQSMGVAGIAWGTVIASAVGMIYSLGSFIKSEGFHPYFKKEIAVRMFKVGWPVGVRFMLDIGGWTMFVVIIAHMGENELAANQIATKIMLISILPGYGIAEAACIFTGQRFGAGDMDGVCSAYRSSLKIACVVMGSLGLLFVSIPTELVAIFQNDPEVLRIGTQLIILVAIFQVFDVLGMTTSGALNGTGDTRFVMLTSIICSWTVMLPCAYLLGVVFKLGAAGVWIGLIFDSIVRLSIILWRFQSQKWLRILQVTEGIS